MVIEIHFSLHNSTENHEFSYRKFVSREYGPLCKFVFSYERTCMCHSTVAYAAVCSLTNATHGSVDLTIQSGIICNPLCKFVFSYERTCMYNSTVALRCSLQLDLAIQSGIIENSKFTP